MSRHRRRLWGAARACAHRRRLGAELGGRKIFSRTKFLNDLFKEKIPIFTPKISDDLFLVIDHIFQILDHYRPQ